MKNEYFSRLNCLMDPSYSLIDFSEIQSFTIDHFSQLESMKEFINNIPLIILLFDKLTSAPNLIKYVDDGWIYETVDESGEIYGINHNNISVKVSQTDKNTGRLILDMQTTKPSMLYIYASYTTSRIIELQGRWDEVTNFYPILFNGNLRLETPFEVIPILFDDRIWELDRNKNSNDFYVNRTKMQSITLIKSTFYKLYSMTFNTDNDEQLYIEILSDATVGGLLKTIFRNKVTIRLRQKLIIKDGIVDRFWSESNEILLYGTSTFTSPNYLDDLSLVWNYTDGYVSPPKISNIHSIASVNILFIDDPSLTLEEQYIDKLYRPFLLANAKKQINCDELLSKLYFPNGINLTYANDTILFQFICDDLIFTTEPYQFDLNGLVVSTDPYTIGLYINGTDHIDEVNDDGFEYEENNESKSGVIVGICMSAVVITLLGAGITVYFVNRRKERIDPEQKKLIVSK
ncbi:hypothetical protein TRFO_33600 [Tritrichomonas foetus]|uniref:Uncharacterized protein n=1 Tax=Tritrichomonas foetus TaxID=1144522 RepID=A0A1J4JQQ5_9EUKA|nr:hypothetical protein TRFO_33600 [Tritrichomonas foetus]|eukprot:OHS99851.1 hypothetical protein TRFO_33600 [Tritrichomonas foetus]